MQSANGAVVATEALTRSFGARRAVDGVTLSVGTGETLALFGPNGAGKTTLLRMLGGLLRPSSGKAQIGDAILPGGPEVRGRIGVISHQTLLYDALTARENVEFAARLYRVRDPRDKATEALDRMRVLDRADTPVRALSRGLRQRVSVARAIVHSPSVVLADEPFTGLDVAGAKALASLLGELRAAGAALILVTHNIDEGLGLATHAAIMDRGRLVRHEIRSAVNPSSFAREYQELVSANG
ncbi:MAG TPA: ABC transporter ATP-binding protein [Gemmatimonadaceae bacterium]|nr:ABC transporter ATP-binding protein [Gemmatimonadaceae bacterium]